MLPQVFKRMLGEVALLCPGGWNIRPTLHRWRGAHIGKNVWISKLVYIDSIHPEGVTIGDDCTIGLRTSIFTHFYWGPRRRTGGFKEVVIGPKAFIGPHCVVLPGVKVGEGAVVRAGTVLTHNVPPHTFWGAPTGKPLAKVQVPLTPEHSWEEFLSGLQPFH